MHYKMRLGLITLVFVSLSGFLAGQQSDVELQDPLHADLLFYGDAMINSYEASSRERAAKEFEQLFDSYLSSNPILSQKDDFLKFISIKDAPDNKFKLVSWLIKLDEGQVDYKGYVVFEDTVIKLNQGQRLAAETAYSTSDQDSWYGCLYYNIMPYKGNSYLVFGYDANGRYDNQRILDIMTVNDDKTIEFGAPIFEDKESLGTFLNRIIISYSSDASVTLNYSEEMDLIIHDHLETRMGQQAGQGPTNIPDGTYEGYEKKKNLWYYKEKLFNHVYEDAPRPNPVFHNKEEKK